MGYVSLKIGDGTTRFKTSTMCSSRLNILMILSVITTNIFALYAFTSSPKLIQTEQQLHQQPHKSFSLISEQVSLILREIDKSQKKLSQIEKQLIGYESLDLSKPNIPKELKLFLTSHKLLLGRDSKTGITKMVSSVGHSCEKSSDLLFRYMNYNVFGNCQDDSSLAQKLTLKGCEHLPRRRCFAKSVSSKVKFLHPFLISLWKPVSNKTVNWNGFSCKSFECLNGKKLNRDCVHCFDLVNGYENQRFVKSWSKNDFLVDDVLQLGTAGGFPTYGSSAYSAAGYGYGSASNGLGYGGAYGGYGGAYGGYGGATDGYGGPAAGTYGNPDVPNATYAGGGPRSSWLAQAPSGYGSMGYGNTAPWGAPSGGAGSGSTTFLVFHYFPFFMVNAT